MYNPYDFYFNQAKKQGYKARSAFKLEEIDLKYKLFDKTIKNVLDIGCAPGSWIQYVHKRLSANKTNDFKILGFDIKDSNLGLPGVYTYNQDITDTENVDKIISSHGIDKFDIIISDMAPNTIGFKDVDAMRSIALLTKTLWIYEKYLNPGGKIAIKIFMGPGFDEFVRDIKKTIGDKNIKIFKPSACRKESKETYIVKY